MFVNLTSLADDLYTKPTHFLLELIQNADDNKYAADSPTITFNLMTNLLLVSCNELGFTPDDVRAICSIGQSTKSASRKASGYIGEKGIGFKSGFKLADTICVSSASYSFKFVRSGRLGMITPIWEDFPSQHFQEGLTQFLFHIPESNDVLSVETDLCNLEGSVLLFLRRLERIELEPAFGGNRFFIRDSFPGLAGEIVRIDDISADGISFKHYTIERTEVKDLPDDPKRPGIHESEVAVAFPLSPVDTPLVKDCFAYNFLPIRKYGFSVSSEFGILDRHTNITWV